MKLWCLSVILIFGLQIKSFNGSKETKETRNYKTFPPKFSMGLSTASYQIEGGYKEGGKGVSTWDTFTQEHPELIANRSNGNVADDSYHLYKEDIAALKKIKADHYRFSISWTRIFPNGEASVKNQPGIDYYHKLIDGLLAEGIEPIVTMFHYDTPQFLEDFGGWLNPYIIEHFRDYADFLYSEYGSKVKRWITFNQPQSICALSYNTGNFPPLFKGDSIGEYKCAHNLIIAHAKAYHVYKDKYFDKYKGKVGISIKIEFNFPADPNNPEDVAAAERLLQFKVGLYAHPIFSTCGDYPQVVKDIVNKNSIEEGRSSSRLPAFSPKMVEYIKGTADFYGLNYYTSSLVTPLDPLTLPEGTYERDVHANDTFDPEWPASVAFYIVSIPDGMYSSLSWLKYEYNNPEVLITENGWPDLGELEDYGRITYLQLHLETLLKAIRDGCNVVGYTAWSLLDNFEWIFGYVFKFGVYRVDVERNNFTRVPKKSSKFLRKIFKTKMLYV